MAPAETMPRLLIDSCQLAAVERHALAAYPEECCGLLVGSAAGGGPVRVHWVEPCRNRAPGRRGRSFTIAPEALLAAYRRARAGGQQLVGCYHSHIDAAAVPSAADRRSAWPGASYLIVGLSAAGVREHRSWWLAAADSEFVEQELPSPGGRPGAVP